MTTAEIKSKCRELAMRDSDGITIGLWADLSDETNPEILVQYEDRRTGESFTLHPPANQALNAYYHPNSFANRVLASGKVLV